MRKILLIIVVTMLFVSCKHTYYYSDDSDKASTIEADSDSAAYVQAYQTFRISLKVYNDMTGKYGSDILKKPTKFILRNSDKIDITDKVSFENKEKVEEEIKNKIGGSPNVLGKDSSDVYEEGMFSKRDTIGLYASPIKITNARFVKKEYSNYRDVRLSYKNVSNKTVKAIRFRWHGKNAFDEPADMGGVIKGMGGGFTEDVLKPNQSDYGIWSVLSRDGKTIVLAYPTEVAFSDGSKWKLGADE